MISGGIGFDAGHRVVGHPRCGSPHGHHYSVGVEIGAGSEYIARLHDRLSYVRALLDGGMIVHAGDTDLYRALVEPDHGWRVVVLNAPPSLHNIAGFIFGVVQRAFVPATEIEVEVQSGEFTRTIVQRDGGVHLAGVDLLEHRGG